MLHSVWVQPTSLKPCRQTSATNLFNILGSAAHTEPRHSDRSHSSRAWHMPMLSAATETPQPPSPLPTNVAEARQAVAVCGRPDGDG